MTNLRIVRDGLEVVSRIGKALDHPLRVRALAALLVRELCVCELIELFGLAPSTISKHMSVIADSGLIVRRREGKWTYYVRATGTIGPVADALSLVDSLVADDPLVASDRERIPTLYCRSDE